MFKPKIVNETVYTQADVCSVMCDFCKLGVKAERRLMGDKYQWYHWMNGDSFHCTASDWKRKTR